MTAANIIFHSPEWDTPPGPDTSENDLRSQSFIAVWCLAGMPLIITGMWAVYNKHDVILRIYMVYLACTFVMDIVYMWDILLENDACHSLPPNLQFHGFAFACGATRFFVFSAAVIFAAVEAYTVYVVWSYIEELVDLGIETLSFADLRADAKEALYRNNLPECYGGILGYAAYSGKTSGPVQVCLGPGYANYGIDQ